MALNDISRSEIWSYLNKDICLLAFGRHWNTFYITFKSVPLMQGYKRKINKLEICLGLNQYGIIVKCNVTKITTLR